MKHIASQVLASSSLYQYIPLNEVKYVHIAEVFLLKVFAAQSQALIRATVC